jgi:hypothetical protein
VHAIPHAPQLLTSDCNHVHAPAQHAPEVQLVPSARFVHAVVLVLGWQVWQGVPGFA